MQNALLRNGPISRPTFDRLCQKTAQTLKLRCPAAAITFRNIAVAEHPIRHSADRVTAQIAEHIELCDVSEIVQEHGGGMTLTAFKTFVSQYPRLTRNIFIVPGQRWRGRKRTTLNICDAQSLLRAIRLAGCRGIALLDLASEYHGCGKDLKQFLDLNTIVQVMNRVYCVSVAQPKIEGALEAWNGGHL